ncbi:MAG: hypothetical protein QM687_06405 [Ferruginibacter sp.]
MRNLLRSICFCILLMTACFAKAQTITITKPNGGEVLYPCQSYTITWTQTGTPSNYWNIDYSIDGGTIWASVATNYLSTNGQFVWTVPNVTTTTALIRVYDAQNTATVDQSDALFSIQKAVTLTAPNGGEVLTGNSVYNITWDAIAGGTTGFTISYSINNGSTWSTIVSNYDAASRSYAWTVPTIALNTNCLVRIGYYSQSCTQDVSDAVFTITPPTPFLISPNVGQTWQLLCNYNITWFSSTLYTTARIDYSIDGGTQWNLIVDNASNSGTYTWYVPVTIPPSANCLIRICNTNNVGLADISNAPFTIAVPVTVTAPANGASAIGCNNLPISFTKTTCAGAWTLYYSTDNGATYTTIGSVADNGSTTQTYNWTVPNGINSSTAKIKVSSSSYAAYISDESDGNFTFTASNDITVTSPNGGETLTGLTTHNITWTNLPTSSGQYNIHYSTNSGSTWTSIATNVTGNSYSWSVPNLNVSNCLIRVQDNLNTCKFDVSDAIFTIAPATPVLTSPNVAQTWQLGCAYTITWNTATLYTTARLDYSVDNGTTWVQITSATSNSGSYSWTVPATLAPSTQCLIRISNTGNLALNDVSNVPFTIGVPVTVTSFNTGGTAIGCGTATISFSKSPCLGTWYIYYSDNNGASYSLITSVADNGSSTQSYTWSVPNGINTTTAKIKVTSVNYPAATDESDGNFTIIPSNDITVTSPNGGETLTGATNHTITWTNLPTASGQYNIHYSINGTTWTSIASNITGNSYVWSVPNINAPSCRIRVQDYLNTCKNDESDATFAIAPVQPALISPNGGEVWQLGCAYNISWLTSTLYTTVKIDYSVDNGTTWVQIVSNATNNGSYSWTVPTTLAPSTQCLIRISNTGNLALNDVSNAPFTIAVPVTVTSFNTGGTAIGCGTATISFSKSPCLGNWYIYYSQDNGANYSLITSLTENGSTIQTYSWQVPNDINTTTAKIKVTNVNYATVTDESEGNFTIIPSNDITVTAPNGGETLTGLTPYNITWTNLSTASGQYTLRYSVNNGSTWTTIASNITGNSYSWTPPNTTASTCLVRVIDYINTCKYDVSNAVFSIVPATPVLLTPNGGQSWQVGCPYSITWNTAYLYTTARLDYTLDGGTTWTNITTAATNSGSYSWTVPATVTPSSNCLIRISNTGNLALNDVSNAPFTIPVPLTVNSFNTAGSTVVGCGTSTISFTKTTCAGNWNIYYSVNNGATWNIITTVTDNGLATQSYTWSVPNNENTATAKIMVSSATYTNITDESDASFSMIPSNDITVTSPNGGETLTGLTPYTITWTNLPTASGQYTLRYSTNGTTYTTIASNITGNSYVWTPPNTTSSTCFIRVIDYVNTCKYDVSDAAFSITPATPVLISPSVAQTWQLGCAYDITWLSSTLYTTARLDYTLDGGTTWTNITTAATNSGSYSWTVPATLTPSSNCLVRISNTGNLALNDVSNEPFTIAVPVTVTSFNTGGNVIGCNTVPITFSKSPCLGNWYLYYSVNNGASWTFISSVTESGTVSQTYNWQVPNGVSTTTAKIKVASVSYPGIEDDSEGNFTITPSNDITVTAANGGESWQGLSTKAITWTNLPGASGQYTLRYSVNNGSTWSTIASNITGNSYNWTLPNLSSSQCLIRVIDYVNTCKFDNSDAVFTIYPATPVLTAPNGGQSWYAGTTNNITWNSATLYTSTVRLDYSVDNGANWINIITNATNNGAYSWTAPLENSTNCLVRISNFGDLPVNDVSDAVFTIKPAVTILTPNDGGQVNNIGGCTVTSITFDHSPAFNSFYLEYTLNNGLTWTTITTNFTATANPATYNWNVPNISTTQARVSVRPTVNTYTDMSDQVFPIIKAVTLIQPNFGGIMQAGSTYDISWSSDGISSVYDLFYTTNGTTYTNIVTGYNTSNNKYTWTVPNIPSANCRIVIRDNINTCKTDTSDQAFIISTSAAPITLVQPNGITDTVNACGSYTISWTETSTIGTYNIAYSLNGGTTWTDIVTNYSTATNSYTWAVPAGIATNQALLRVSAAANASVYDLSNAYFVIAQPIYTFTGNGNWTIPSNWVNSQVPPANPPACTEIIIDNQANGECILNIPYTLPAGAKLTVKEGKKLTIAGNLNIQ